jgi:hypothetical protein
MRVMFAFRCLMCYFGRPQCVRRAEGATEWTEQPNNLNLIRQLAIPICKSTYNQTVKDLQNTPILALQLVILIINNPYHTSASVLDGTVVGNNT